MWKVIPTFRAQDEGLNSMGAYIGTVYGKAINSLENGEKFELKGNNEISKKFNEMKKDIKKIKLERNQKYDGSFIMIL